MRKMNKNAPEENINGSWVLLSKMLAILLKSSDAK